MEEVIVSGTAAMTIAVVADFFWTGLLLSFTVAVKLEVPFEAGVPEITPVVAASVNPEGKLPDVIDHV